MKKEEEKERRKRSGGRKVHEVTECNSELEDGTTVNYGLVLCAYQPVNAVN